LIKYAYDATGIMAGCKGSRLERFTKIFPKPLIPFYD